MRRKIEASLDFNEHDLALLDILYDQSIDLLNNA